MLNDTDLKNLEASLKAIEDPCADFKILETPTSTQNLQEINEKNQALQNELDAASKASLESSSTENFDHPIEPCLEALYFLHDKPLSLEQAYANLKKLLPHITLQDTEAATRNLQKYYQKAHHGIELIEVAHGFQFRTKLFLGDLLQKLTKVHTQKLSHGAMETLSIIAFKQPVTKDEIDKIRGVDSSYFIRNLIDKSLINIIGRSELVGRPMLYGTTAIFLETFGLKDLHGLPSMREIEESLAQLKSVHNNRTPEDQRIHEQMQDMIQDHYRLAFDAAIDEENDQKYKETLRTVTLTTPTLEQLKVNETTQTKEPDNLCPI